MVEISSLTSGKQETDTPCLSYKEMESVSRHVGGPLHCRNDLTRDNNAVHSLTPMVFAWAK